MESVNAIELRNITKRFGSVVANDRINLALKRGQILSLLGENGSGKTTLMNMLAGIYLPDEGEILADGVPITIRSPKDSFDHKIGMIHQHYKLVEVFTATQNIILGLEEKGGLNLSEANKKVKEICDRYGFEIDPKKKVYDMSVSEKQTVEIVKVLYRGADILILDEPTAVLTPQETEKLFAVMRNMRADGKALVIITHKLNEVLAISDEVAVLRKGKYIGTVKTSETTAQALTDMMVGHSVTLNIERPRAESLKDRLVLKNVTVKDKEGVKKLNNVSFEAYGGEILGVAGVAGSGQKELLEAIAGLQKLEAGSVIHYTSPEGDEQYLNGLSPLDIIKKGILLSFVPEDRFGMGLVGGMSITDNIKLRTYRNGKLMIADFAESRALAERIVTDLEVVTPDINRTPIRRLSGGNVQKVLVGREIAFNPSVLMTAYAVRGLDINTSYAIYNLLTDQKMKGAAVIYVGEDLDVLLELCDKIMVLCGGEVSGIVDAHNTTKEQIGLLMTTVGGKKEESHEA